MPRTKLNVKALARDAAFDAAAAGVYQAGDNVNNNYVAGGDAGRAGALLLHIKNTNVAAQTVTVKAGSGGDVGPAWRAGLGDLAISVPATNGERMYLVQDTARFRQANGDINIDVSGANVTIAPLLLPL